MEKITEFMELSYIRKMGNRETNEVENELIVLFPVGCYWAKQFGSCTYCGYQPLVDEIRAKYENIDYMEILDNEINKQKEPIHRISFFVGGSFFEIPREDRIKIFQYVKMLDINDVYIETRPELVTEKNVKELKEILGDKKLWVAIGLETYDEHIRNKVHKKGITDEVYVKAMQILNDANVLSLVYVFVKPPVENISDTEAFEEAYRTIEYCFDSGCTAIELECGYIVENSYIKQLYDENKYKPLKLWTIQKLLKDTIELNKGTIRLAYFTDTPEPIDGPKNCEKCSQEFYDMFNEYRRTMDTNILYREINCECKENWKNEVKIIEFESARIR